MHDRLEPFPSFASTVPPRGYQWWYFDASSDDGRDHLVIIAFVGSVFSPFYKSAVMREPAEPVDYCAINVGLYSHRLRQARWVMTECRRQRVRREAARFAVSGSLLQFDGQSLTIDIDERAAPLPLPVRGRVRVHPLSVTADEYALDSNARHHWWPVSPRTRVEVSFDQPGVRWSGHGYFDTNRGDEPLHEGFDTWHWHRTHHPTFTRIAYNALDRTGKPSSLSLRIEDDGNTHHEQSHNQIKLPPTRIWRAPRAVHLPGPVRVIRTLEDTPFYARSILAPQDPKQPVTFHESLSLERFRANWVTRLIPFRMRFPLRR